MTETFEQYTARMLALAGTDEPLGVLAATPARIAALLAGRAAADLRWTSDPGDSGRWCIAEIVSHLADSELVLAYRARMMLSASGTPIQAFDQAAWARSQHAASSDAFESLTLFASTRWANLRLLRRLTEEERDRFGMHAERGHESIRQLERLYAGHDRNHVAQIERLLAARGPGEVPPTFSPAPAKAEIDPSDLERLDVRAGTILRAEPVAGADRLALLTVAFGDRQRSIVAGIRAERPSLEAIVGRQALFVLNLPPKTIRGQRSEGMLFDIGFADGLRPAFAVPEWPMPDGVRAG
jgi:tRNA-binding EMAP/Myf-like protein